MKDLILDTISQVITTLKDSGVIPNEAQTKLSLGNTKDKSHGDFASNVALSLAKQAGIPPRQLAEQIVSEIEKKQIKEIEKIDIAGPGFINFFVSASSNFDVIEKILTEKEKFGRSTVGSGKKIQVEFVSANPTGPLHVGHGRGAAYGASVSDLLEAAGFEVEREYYVNDAGRQMNILAASIWLRYLELFDSGIPFPVNGYKGDYINDIAAGLKEEHGDRFFRKSDEITQNLPKDENEGGDKEEFIDAIIARAKDLLNDDYESIFDVGLKSIVADIREDLSEFSVSYQNWFSEKSVQKDIDSAIEKLEANGHIYEQDGALWFRSTTFGDDKDRVVKRDNGETTYFASDIAYHLNKFERGYDKVINIWGADHHGYIPRVKAALQALDIDPNKLEVRLVQFAILYRGKERVQMSTRSGSFVTLRELREEVGNDAARFFYVTRKAEQHMDFDLDLAKSESKDNPVYYIQYAHARIASMLRKLDELNLKRDDAAGLQYLSEHGEDSEVSLAKQLAKYAAQLENAAVNCEPHVMTHYLRELASEFHTYYNSNKVLVDDDATRFGRVTLSVAIQQVLANGLKLLGVSAPEEM